MEEALRLILKQSAAVGEAVDGFVEWAAQPEGRTAPYITLHRIGGLRSQTTDGPDGMIESRVQVDCWGTTYTEAKIAARAVIFALNGHRDMTFRHVAVENERDDHDLDPPDPLYRTSLDLRVIHKA